MYFMDDPQVIPPRLENEIESWSLVPKLKEYLLNNSYEKIVDLDENNFRLACFYKTDSRQNMHTYFEIDEAYINFSKTFFASPTVMQMNSLSHRNLM